MQGHGRIVAPNFCVAHREANSGLSTLNRTKSILSIYHQQRQLHNQRGMCLNDTYPFCQQPLSGNCHSICFSKPVLWTATSGLPLFSYLTPPAFPERQDQCGDSDGKPSPNEFVFRHTVIPPLRKNFMDSSCVEHDPSLMCVKQSRERSSACMVFRL